MASKMIPRAQVFKVLAESLASEDANSVFKQALDMCRVTDKGMFTPDELTAISNAMLDIAARAANKAAQDVIREELFGPSMDS